MNVTLVSTVSILGIAALVWTVNRLLKTRWCPICLGVGGTWLWMIVARFAGVPIDPTMLSILLGGSVAGLSYLLERRLPQDRSKLVWKTLFIPIGFIGAYGVAAPDWSLFVGAMAAALILTAVFARATPTASADNATVADLERRMKDCC
jgi:hypothetical protein